MGELLRRVSSTRLHAQFAKAREADGHYLEAARAYENARDYDSATRCVADTVYNILMQFMLIYTCILHIHVHVHVLCKYMYMYMYTYYM